MAYFCCHDVVISFSFSSFNTESGYDYVMLNPCVMLSCSLVTQVAWLLGNLVNSGTSYTLATRYLQVVFTSDGRATSFGFVAQWIMEVLICTECEAGKYKIATANAACTNCLAGSYSMAVGATSHMCQGCPT